ncbi:MAG: HelD family protein [Bacilli bacterium]
MSIEKSELDREKSYLLKVKQVLEEIISISKLSVDNSKNDISDLKRFMWNNLSDYTDEERAIALYEVDRSVDLTNKQIDTIARYEKALNSPYFGKLIFMKDQNTNEMPIYIGITSVQKGLQFYVFDWRAPIASMFYNYELGTAEYETPNGKITGEILSKMQFKIVNGELLRCFKSDINIDDEYLQEILANSSGDKMKNIVSTIQREQNEIIRNSSDKYLIVQGVAGSGKTSVALHRIAYLLYQDIHLSSNNILILSPSDIFSDYISNVLPELGEQNVLKSTFTEFAALYLKPYKKIESYNQFLERVYNKSNFDQDLLRYKMSDQYEKDISEFFESYEKNIYFSSGIKFENHLITSQQLRDLFLNKFQKLPIKERIEALSEHICFILGLPKSKYISHIKKRLIESSNIELNFYDLYQEFLKSDRFNSFENIVTPKGKINYEDIAGLLYMYVKINGNSNNNHIRQVVIDEVQDYTHFQMKIIKEFFERSSFTVLGDVNQGINPYYKYESLSSLSDVFPKSKYIELTKTYRSSQEIIDYSNRILNLDNVCSVRHNMNIPVKTETISSEQILSKIRKDLIDMKDNNLNRIAIITRDNEQALYLYDKMSSDKQFDIQLVSSVDTSIKNSSVIIPSYLSKGLEFDGVVVYNDSNDSYRSGEENLYYVVCTRAQHQLTIYNEPVKLLKRNLEKKDT